MEIRALTNVDLERVDAALPLSRLDQAQTYLVAWDGDEPVGHAHVAWQGTHLGLPEVQDVYVLPTRRREGVATALTRASEDAARRRGHARISLSVSRDGNPAARRLYEQLGYRDAAVDPVRVQGAILLRGERFEVDDTLLYLVKDLG
ncbi:MAG TPA: GNAT family N-acetyltransferase [Gaiellaceae bacterium]